MNFEQFSLDPRIHAGIRDAGYTQPTPIQAQAIPQVLEGGDLLGLAQTGTGKTAAFVLPILQRLTQGPLRKVRALIVAPTRELAEQIHQTITELGKHTRIRSVTIYGGVGKGPQIGALRRGAEIVVACPGRLLDHINDGTINLSQVEVLVLDEADRMCDMGFLPDIRRILSHLPAQRQTLFFSATMPSEIRTLADSILNKPATVQIGMIAPAETVTHVLYPVPDNLKTKLLFAMLQQTATGRVLIFTRTKRRARNLALDLENQRYRVAALQGNMAQNRRQEAINGFRDGKYDILVATDIAARGIDVSEISHVINFDMPDTVEAYTHRIGRTGRATHTGEAYTFTAQADELMVRDIERTLGKPIERRRLPGFDYGSFSPEAQQTLGQAGQHHRRVNGSGRSGQSQSNRPQHKAARPAGERSASFNGSQNRPSRRRRPASTSA
jgi:ATP-dependent RNA helicase RhlE